MTPALFSARIAARRRGWGASAARAHHLAPLDRRAGMIELRGVFAGRGLAARSAAAREGRVFLRPRRPFAITAAVAGASSHGFHQSSVTREVLREILRHEIRTVPSPADRIRETTRETAVLVERAPGPSAPAPLRPGRRAASGAPVERVVPRPELVAPVAGPPVFRPRAARGARLEPRSPVSPSPPSPIERLTSRVESLHTLRERLQVSTSTFTLFTRARAEPRVSASVPARSPASEVRPQAASPATVFTAARPSAAAPAPARPGAAARVAIAPPRAEVSSTPARPLLAGPRASARERPLLHIGPPAGAAPATPAARGLAHLPARELPRPPRAAIGSRLEHRRPGRGTAAAVPGGAAAPAALPPRVAPPDREVVAARSPARRPPAPGLEYLRPKPAAPAPARIEETVRRQVEEKVERTISLCVDTAVARELAPDSTYSRTLGDRICSAIYEGIVLERERMGWR